MIYQTLEDAIVSAKEFADAFDMEGFVKITSAPDGGYELFGSGEIILVVWQTSQKWVFMYRVLYRLELWNDQKYLNIDTYSIFDILYVYWWKYT